jgi:hypothetical protein
MSHTPPEELADRNQSGLVQSHAAMATLAPTTTSGRRGWARAAARGFPRRAGNGLTGVHAREAIESTSFQTAGSSSCRGAARRP